VVLAAFEIVAGNNRRRCCTSDVTLTWKKAGLCLRFRAWER